MSDYSELKKLLWSEVAAWSLNCESWQRSSEALGEFLGKKTVEEVALELLAENEALRKALSDLVSGDVGQSVQWKLSSGQGAETADGKAWLAAAAMGKGEQS